MKNFISNLNYESIVSKMAIHAFKKHQVLKEWKTIIIALLVAKLLTNTVSMYAGFNMIYSYVYQFVSNHIASFVSGLIILLIIEVLTIAFMNKAFKFLLKGDFKTAAFPLVLSILMFAASFHLSTNGLALERSEMVDNTVILADEYKFNQTQTKTEYSEQISYLQERILDIKANPQGWTGGVRSVLLSDQLAMIDSYTNDIKTLHTERKTALNKLEKSNKIELDKNTATMANEAKKYYDVATAIMLGQILFSGLLMHYWSGIYEDKEKDAHTKEIVQTIASNIDSQVFALLMNKINGTAQTFGTAIEIAMGNSGTKPLLIPVQNKAEADQEQSQNDARCNYHVKSF